MAKKQHLIAFIFRVHREKVDGHTVKVMLEPYTDEMMINVEDGMEFITGGLAVNPWKEEEDNS